MTKPLGRPKAGDITTRRNAAQKALEETYPSLAGLIRKIEVGELSPADLQQQSAAIIAEVEKVSARNPNELTRSPRLPERQLAAADKLNATSRSYSTMLEFSGLISMKVAELEGNLERAKAEFLVAISEQDEMLGYEKDLLGRFKEAGIDVFRARSVTTAHITRLFENISKGHKRGAVDPAEPPIEDSNGLWGRLLSNPSGFIISRHKIEDSKHSIDACPPCHFPPFGDLRAFCQKKFYEAYAKAKKPLDKYNRAANILEKWFSDEGVVTSHPDRDRAWLFLFALKDGYAAELDKFDNFRMFSPFADDEFLEVTRSD